MLILPSPLRSQINIVRQSKGLANVTADVIINIAQELIANMTPAEVSAAMGYTKTPTSSTVSTGTMASKWADDSSTTSSSIPSAPASIPIQHGSDSKVTKPTPPIINRTQPTSASMYNANPAKGAKFCAYHKSRAHNTNECNAYAAVLSAGNTSNSSTNSPPCRDCGAPNYVPGHQCTTASRTGKPPSAPEHRFRMMHVAEGSPRVDHDTTSVPVAGQAMPAQVKRYCTFHKSTKHNTKNCKAFAEHLHSIESEILSGQPNLVNAASSATSPADSANNNESSSLPQIDDRPNDLMDVDTIIATTAAQKCKLNEFSSLPINKSCGI
ncbi:hypothetical protein MAM1_1164c11490 [Mucor ambiguus]|uniref:Uncharacterized protein n=1 Tax=Mucor ambiguus TaxID=91626 RepID=A0A0C9LZC9_9FUNG|nr:hypothetical protein MAM1_1164c11490 [Mucor ambiguus]